MIYYIVIAALILSFIPALALLERRHRFAMAVRADEEEVRRNAAELALEMTARDRTGVGLPLYATIRKIRRSYRLVCKRADEDLLECEKRLYENGASLLARMHIRSLYALDALPRSKGRIRVVALARLLLSLNAWELDGEKFGAGVKTFNKYAPLDNEEVFALPAAAEYVLLRRLSAMCERMIEIDRARRYASKDKIYSSRRENLLGYAYFRKISGQDAQNEYSRLGAEKVEITFGAALTEINMTIAQCLRSFKSVGEIFTAQRLLSFSVTDERMSEEETYRAMDDASRMAYTAAVAKTAKLARVSERAAAEKALQLGAREEVHFGKFLFEERARLIRALKGKPDEIRSDGGKARAALYFSAIFVFSALFAVITAVLMPTAGLAAAAFFLVFVAAQRPIDYLLARIASRFLPARPVPRLKLESIPEKGRTIAAVSVLVKDVEQANSALDGLIALKSCNDEENAAFVLLADLPESASETQIEDDNIVRALKRAEGLERVFVLVRRRSKCGKIWRGRERKRGAIEDMNALLLGGGSENFLYMSAVPETPEYVVLLDADSIIAPGGIKRVVAAMMHPLAASVDLMAFTCRYKVSTVTTLHGRAFLNESGEERYCAADDFYYDLCGRSVFCGKGIYRLKSFAEKLRGALPEGRVLSHDIAEGALTHTASAGECVFEDVPPTYAADVSRKRRWQRGDLLLLPLAFSSRAIHPLYRGVVLRNFFEILRPCALLAAIIAALCLKEVALLLVFALLVFAMPLARAGFELDSAGNGVRYRYALRGAFSAIGGAFTEIFSLPAEAAGSITVMAKTIRKLIFGGDLLEWKTFAVSMRERPARAHIAAILPALLLCALLSATAVVSLAAPVYAATCALYMCLLALGGIEVGKAKKLNKEDKDILRSIAMRTYAYFSEMRERSTYITDNFAFEPRTRSAKMTSPTDMGMAMLAHVCACECGVISEAEATARLEEDIAKAEKLKKWRGNLYNWYDTEGKVLSPRFVSSVDSGNFLACLICVRAFLKNAGADTQKVSALIENTRLETLVDESCGRLYIGYNEEDNRFEGHYDMLASEARTAAYIVSCRLNDTRVWFGAKREMIARKGNMLVAWAGTVFEYLMPQLFFPDAPYAFISSSCKKASRIMSKKKESGVFGKSESGCYEFDDCGNYVYKQFGESCLSLLAGTDGRVISPYASALMLRYIKHRAVVNLQKLKKRGAYAKFGFCEALDLNVGKAVGAFMTHHQGMILAAITNELKEDVLQKLFCSDPLIKGGMSMLEEKTPRCRCSALPVKERKYEKAKGLDFFAKYDVYDGEHVAIIGEGRCSAVLDECGGGYTVYGGETVSRRRRIRSLPDGGFFVIREQKETFSPTFFPLKDANCRYTFEYSCQKVKYDNLSKDCSLEVMMLPGMDGELRKLTITNKSDSVKSYLVTYSERIAFASEEEYLSHPVYADMFVSAFSERETLFLKKSSKSRGGDKFCAAMMTGVKGMSLSGNARKEDGSEISSSLGSVLYPEIRICGRVDISPQKSAHIYLMKAFSSDLTLLKKNVFDIDKEGFFGYCEKFADMPTLRTWKYRGDIATNMLIDKIAPQLLYPTVSAQNIQFIRYSGGEKCLLIDYEKDFSLLESAIFAALYLNLCGLKCSLYVVIDRSDKDFSQKSERVIRGKAGDISSLGIVHIIDNFECKNRFGAVTPLSKTLNTKSQSAFSIGDGSGEGRQDAPDAKESRAVCEHIEKPPKKIVSGCGYFTDGGYVVDKPCLLPYSNVIAGDKGGFVVTQNGGGFTFFDNSCENKVTFWSADPVEDMPSERLFAVIDGKRLRVNKLDPGGYVLHGRGQTVFCGRAEGVSYRLTLGLIRRGEGKVYRLRLQNREKFSRAVTLEFSLLLQLSRIYEPFSVKVSPFKEGLKAVNALTGSAAFVKCLGGCEVVCKKDVAKVKGKKRSCGAYAPCAELRKNISLSAEGSLEIYFLICSSEEVFDECNEENIGYMLEEGLKTFEFESEVELFGVPEEERALMRALPYQVYSSRLKGRCGFYQAGGAIGFRDQLQDCLAHIYADEKFVADMIADCAAHQYEEGDVMHWWHPPMLGVRTRIVDDRLFLGYVTAEYIRHTGDKSILERKIPYLSSKPLSRGEDSRMEQGRESAEKGRLLEHILCAIDSACELGEHSLVKIGGGDWNDALNEIGSKGRGESVWLSEFAYDVIMKTAPYIPAEKRGRYLDLADKLKRGINAAFFDGRYARAFTDEGVWLGREDSPCCKIDIISQAWAVIARVAEDEKARSALEIAKKLIDEHCGVVRLLAPAFDKQNYCGYISAYPEGVRENGGQYTHAAVWLFKAFCLLGDVEYARKLARMLDPIYACQGEGNARYKGEPYVIAADVYYAPEMKGRMGWSWYTGSAAWYFKTYLEDYIGFRIENGAIECKRPLAADAEKIVVRYRRGKAVFNVRFAFGEEEGVRENGINMRGVRIDTKRPPGEYDLTFLFKKDD